MRVITGSLKGRYIEAVPSTKTRPTSDKIKEAVFHIIGPYFDGGHALDLFAGSGSLGIEAISRGMESVTFIDYYHEAIRTIRKNIRQLKIENNSEVYRNDALRALQIFAKKRKQFDLIFIDPPYESKLYSELLKIISENDLIKQDGVIYIEHVPKRKFTYDGQYYERYFNRKYSKTIEITLLQRKKVNQA